MTADGCGGERLMQGAGTLPDGYAGATDWDWPESYSEEFADDLVGLVRPNGV